MNADLVGAVPDLDVLLDAVSAGATECAMNSQDHGPRHWRDVARVGVALARETPRTHAAVVFCFALLHDTQRLNEYDDRDHGPRAAAFAVALADRGLLALTGNQLSALVTACECHTGSGPVGDPTLGVCLDADRLTLWRVGKVPLAHYLSTAAGRDDAAPRWSRELLESPDVAWAAICAAYGAACADWRTSVEQPDRPTDTMRRLQARADPRWRGDGGRRAPKAPRVRTGTPRATPYLMNERDSVSGPGSPKEEKAPGLQPEPPAPRRVFFKLPDDYWAWTEEQQRAWASEAAKALQQKLGIEPTT